MPWSLADARFLLRRASGLLRRGMASLRTRGMRASWERTLAQFRRLRPAPGVALFDPGPVPEAGFALPTSDAPLASIVIPVYDQVAHTMRCLFALSQLPADTAFEVIVVDDGSNDATPQRLPGIGGLRYHRRASNGGFIAACNDGARLARGEVLVFLNNDTVPQPGWLDALVDTLRGEEDIGLVGAQLLSADGRLQESGAIIFSDGSAWNYGRYESPDDPRYAYRRNADYVSGAAMALRRDVFQAVGGFDVRYAPAYYEDADLAFAVRDAGLRVLVQPRARVVHEEGITAGTDTGSGIKSFQVRNQSVFARHRSVSLRRQPAPHPTPGPAWVHRNQPQILVLEAHTPRPDHDSASMRLANLMRMTTDAGAHVVFVPLDFAHGGEATRALQAAGIECWYAPYITSLSRWLREHGPRFDTVLASRLHVADSALPLLRAHAPGVRKIFDTVDLHFLRESRAAELLDDMGMRSVATRTRSREVAMARAYDLTLVVSEQERALLQPLAPRATIEVLSNLHDIPGTTAGFGERNGLLFVGGFNHPPNLDAILWFLGEIWPRARSAIASLTLDIAGAAPPPQLMLHDGVAGVRVHGQVSDLAPLLDATRIGIAPLRFGAGVKGKVTLSMAHGQPVVATTCATEGMSLSPDEDLLVADDALAFADAIVGLHQDQARWEALSHAGLIHATRVFSIEASRAAVTRIMIGDQSSSAMA